MIEDWTGALFGVILFIAAVGILIPMGIAAWDVALNGVEACR